MGLYLDYLGNDKFRVDNSITQGSTHLEDLRLPEGDHGVPGRRLEGGHLAAVVEEGLHEAGARQDDGAVQGRVELAAMWAQCHDSYNLLSHGVQHTALWAWMVVFSKSVVLSLTRKFLLCNIPGFFPAAGQFNQILDCCTGCGDMANLTVSALS